MRVLFVVPGMGPGGSERVTANLANHLARQGHEVGLLFFVGEKSFYELDARVQCFPLNSTMDRRSSLTFLFSMAANFRNCLKAFRHCCESFRPDKVVSFQFEADTVVSVCRKGRKWAWISSEINDPTNRSRLISYLTKRNYRFMDLLVCQTKMVLDFYKDLPVRKILLPNAVDLSVIPGAVDEGKETVFVSAGRLSSQKNYPLLIRSFHKACQQSAEPCRLIIYGEGPDRPKLEALIRELQAEEISLPGTADDLLQRIRDAAAFVISSDYEGCSNALLEAVLLGLPVISADHPTGDAKELAKRGYVLTVGVGNEEEMTKALLSLMNDPQRRREMRLRSRSFREDPEIVTSCLQWEKAIQEAGEKL
ncbi:MAG: glycosyltransferase [Erysipelotrichaceae bacterium]|nr:glycosyltransferase [Erysipelotrichaceae bacterium]